MTEIFKAFLWGLKRAARWYIVELKKELHESRPFWIREREKRERGEIENNTENNHQDN